MCVCVCVRLIDSLLWKEREKSERKREEDLDAFSELHNSRGVWAVLWSTHSDKLSLHPGEEERDRESEEGLGQVRTLIIHVCLFSSQVSQPPDTWQEEEGS